MIQPGSEVGVKGVSHSVQQNPYTGIHRSIPVLTFDGLTKRIECLSIHGSHENWRVR
jgi:hypothetical protein